MTDEQTALVKLRDPMNLVEAAKFLGTSAMQWKARALEAEAKGPGAGRATAGLEAELIRQTDRIVDAVTKPRRAIWDKRGEPIGTVVVDSLDGLEGYREQ